MNYDLPQKPGPKPTYPKTVTFTCANSCGGTIDVYLESWKDRRNRYYCCPECRAEYSQRYHQSAWEVRKTGKTGFVSVRSVEVKKVPALRKHEEALRLGRW